MVILMFVCKQIAIHAQQHNKKVQVLSLFIISVSICLNEPFQSSFL